MDSSVHGRGLMKYITFTGRENGGDSSNQKPLSQQYSIKYCNTMPSLLRNVKELKEEFRKAVIYTGTVVQVYAVLSII